MDNIKTEDSNENECIEPKVAKRRKPGEVAFDTVDDLLKNKRHIHRFLARNPKNSAEKLVKNID